MLYALTGVLIRDYSECCSDVQKEVRRVLPDIDVRSFVPQSDHDQLQFGYGNDVLPPYSTRIHHPVMLPVGDPPLKSIEVDRPPFVLEV